MKKQLLTLVVLSVILAMVTVYLCQIAYAYWDQDYDEDTGPLTGSTTWALIQAQWPPRYHNFCHDAGYQFGPDCWGPPPDVAIYPTDNGIHISGYTKIDLYVFKDLSYVETVESVASLPPPE